MRVLITGATGFVGSHCIEALSVLSQVSVIAACRSPAKMLPEFKGELRVGDLRDPKYVGKLCENVDVVIHAAAWSALWGNKKNSHKLYLEPSMNLLASAQNAKVARFVFISSISVAAPAVSGSRMERGQKRRYWPHEANLVRFEDELMERASGHFTVVNLRLGLFAGRRYGLGLLPILVPRLRTHLVPWVQRGRTSMPIIDGRDIGASVALAATVAKLSDYENINVVGPEIPSVREVLTYLNEQFGLPTPHFSVPFWLAFAFGWLMEFINPIVPWEPLVTRSIIHLMEESNPSNDRAIRILGYSPRFHWKEAVDAQMAEMSLKQGKSMRMARALPPPVDSK